MGKQNRSKQKSNENRNTNVPTQVASLSESFTTKIILALIAAIAAIGVAVIGYSATIKGTILPIEFTQTAEAFHTSVAMTITVGAIQTQTEVANISLTAFSGTQIALAIEAEKESLSVSASQTAEVEVFETRTAMALAIPTPTENKPVRIEYTFSKSDTLDDISKKFVGSGLYAIAIGRANCKPTPVEGDVLIIRFYSAQQGDSIDLLAERFSSSPDFLRSINAIDAGVTLLPTDQILILPGKCSN